ncbi:MAG: PQQ-binding-like beta-propeller repeat protein [Planctomycetales bacterium]|nr:PQQ-binding-like beta-propeller repeat protein [Planctomycetales bacterium]
MLRHLLTLSLIISAIPSARALAADALPEKTAVRSTNDWPCWRGPLGTGIADPNQKVPLKWSATENVVWKAPVDGRGHGSPIVVGDRVFLQTAETEPPQQSVLCFDRKTGKQLWKTVVHKGGLVTKGNKNSSLSSSTPCCDGERLFVNFLNSEAIFTTALDLAGKQEWQVKVADYAVHQGFASSPMIYGDSVLVTADSDIGGLIAALSRKNGQQIWSQPRPKEDNYTSPIVHHLAGKDQLLVSGCKLVSSFDPKSGKKLWEIEGSTIECVTSIVTDGERIFVSGGWPRQHVQAILADGSGKTVWDSNLQVYVPSMIVKDGYLYGLQDRIGIATCWKCDTGELMWKERLPGGTISSSLVLVNDNLFATNEAGQTFIYKASPNGYESVAQNQLGSEAFATPAICGNRLYYRVAETVGGKRQEVLYCLGENFSFSTRGLLDFGRNIEDDREP